MNIFIVEDEELARGRNRRAGRAVNGPGRKEQVT